MKFEIKKSAFIDICAIILGLASLLAQFLLPQIGAGRIFSNWICYLSGFIGFMYIFYVARLWFLHRIAFDWHLVNGNFMRRVICLVILLPFSVTLVMSIINKIDSSACDSPMEIIYEKNLYKNGSDNIPEKIAVKQESPTIFWSVYYHFMDPGNQHMTLSKEGRGWTGLAAILGVIMLNGFLVSSIIGWIDGRKERWKKGEIRYGERKFPEGKFAAVIGANETAPVIIKNLLNGKGESVVRYVLLLTNDDVEKVRSKISSYLTKKEAMQLIIYRGELDSIKEIYNLHLRKATEIYVLGEEVDEEKANSYHDTQNMKCVHNIASYLTNKNVARRIVCRVQFEYQTTYSVFQFSEIPKNVRDHLVFIPFNSYENWAQKVLVKGRYTETTAKVSPRQTKESLVDSRWNRMIGKAINKLQAITEKNDNEERIIEYTPLDGNGISADSASHVHFVVVGMSKMGVAMAIQAAQTAHYPNFRINGSKNLRTRITIIDSNADSEMDFFKGRYKNLFDLSRCRYIDASGDGCLPEMDGFNDPVADTGSRYSYLGHNFIDIEWEFIKGNVENTGVRRYLEMAAAQADKEKGNNSLLTIAVCLPLAHEAIAASIYMPDAVYDHAQQIWVYQREASDIVFNLYYDEEGYIHKKYQKLRPFGMQYADFTTVKEYYYRSQLCNYTYDLIIDDKFNNDAINATISGIENVFDKEAMKRARALWKSLKIFDRWSNKYLANSFETKIRSIGSANSNYAINYVSNCKNLHKYRDAMAECEHNRWNVQQLLMGFRACTSEESDMVKKDPAYKGVLKKGREKAHVDIRPFEMLDKSTKDVDYIFNNAIPDILMLIEKSYKERENSQK